MELTTTERWILWNQFTILAALDAESAEYYERAKTALENGFTTAYAWYCGFLTEEVPREVCEEVLEILDRFKAIDNARPDASELDGDDAWQLPRAHAGRISAYAPPLGIDGQSRGAHRGPTP